MSKWINFEHNKSIEVCLSLSPSVCVFIISSLMMSLFINLTYFFLERLTSTYIHSFQTRRRKHNLNYFFFSVSNCIYSGGQYWNWVWNTWITSTYQPIFYSSSFSFILFHFTLFLFNGNYNSNKLFIYYYEYVRLVLLFLLFVHDF